KLRQMETFHTDLCIDQSVDPIVQQKGLPDQGDAMLEELLLHLSAGLGNLPAPQDEFVDGPLVPLGLEGGTHPLDEPTLKDQVLGIPAQKVQGLVEIALGLLGNGKGLSILCSPEHQPLGNGFLVQGWKTEQLATGQNGVYDLFLLLGQQQENRFIGGFLDQLEQF